MPAYVTRLAGAKFFTINFETVMTIQAFLRVASIQVGQARKVQISGRTVLTAIHKTTVQQPIKVRALGLEGDEQADLSVHGGLDKAVYAYPSVHYDFWRKARAEAGVEGLDSELPHGALGENLTLEGVVETGLWLGDVLQFPDCTLRVTQPREPCFKFNAAMGFNTAVKQMALSGHCGFYLAVDAPGTIRQGEDFRLIPGARRVSVIESFNAKMFKHMR
jgi:MOSC domain-containing protein YiiM